MQKSRTPISVQNGMVLVTALLLLIVVTLLALGMFRSFGLDEKIAGNVREKQRALSAAETAEQYAEYWLLNGNNSTTGVTCTGTVAASVGQVCSNPLTSVTSVVNGLWQNSSGASVGVTYTPAVQSAMNVTGSTGGQGTYYYQPAFYITYLGPGQGGKIYQIDAVGYGGSADTVAVVESTYLVQSGTPCLSCSQ